MNVYRLGGLKLLFQRQAVKPHMRVLMIHNDYAMPSGEEHAADKIARILTDYGHTVHWFRRSSSELGNSVRGMAKAFFTGINNPMSAIALNKVLASYTPDVVQVQNVFPLISPSVFGVLRRHRIPVVMRCPNYRLFCPNGRHLVRGQVCEKCLGCGRELWCILKNCENSIMKSTGYAARNAIARVSGSIIRRVHVYLVQSNAQKVKFVRNGIPEEKIEILPGLISVDPFLPQPASCGDYITYVGRVSQEKGIEEFVEASRALPHLSFAVAGDFSQMQSVRDESPPNIRWLGFLDCDRLRTIYLRSRMVIVPSRWYEGFPNVIVQAMALGKPVICSAIGGLPEIVQDGVTGYLFEPGNPRQLVDRICQLNASPNVCRKFGVAAYEKAKREYSLEVGHTYLMQAYWKAIEFNAA